MQTPEFEQALTELLEQAAQQHTVVKCAEALPWRCHRGLIADAAMARGVTVHDIFIAANGTPIVREHKSAFRCCCPGGFASCTDAARSDVIRRGRRGRPRELPGGGGDGFAARSASPTAAA